MPWNRLKTLQLSDDYLSGAGIELGWVATENVEELALVTAAVLT